MIDLTSGEIYVPSLPVMPMTMGLIDFTMFDLEGDECTKDFMIRSNSV